LIIGESFADDFVKKVDNFECMTEQGKYYMATSKSTTVGFLIFTSLFDRSKAGSRYHWLRAPSYQKQNKNLSKPTILTATNDINNQKTINGEIRVYIYGCGCIKTPG